MSAPPAPAAWHALPTEMKFSVVAQLDADATFKNIDIGVAVKDQTKGPAVKSGENALPGGFAQQADSADLKGVKQTAWATTAGTFKLSGLKMRLGADSKLECF